MSLLYNAYIAGVRIKQMTATEQTGFQFYAIQLRAAALDVAESNINPAVVTTLEAHDAEKVFEFCIMRPIEHV